LFTNLLIFVIPFLYFPQLDINRYPVPEGERG
jgi:hypothetical protein